MSWLITVDGVKFNSDDMTVEELGEVEKISGVPWSIANPLREVTVAKAFVAVALLRVDGDHAADKLAGLTLRDLKDAFEWVDDEGQGVEEELDPSAPPPPSTSRNSSASGQAGGGRRAKHVKSA